MGKPQGRKQGRCENQWLFRWAQHIRASVGDAQGGQTGSSGKRGLCTCPGMADGQYRRERGWGRWLFPDHACAFFPGSRSKLGMRLALFFCTAVSTLTTVTSCYCPPRIMSPANSRLHVSSSTSDFLAPFPYDFVLKRPLPSVFEGFLIVRLDQDHRMNNTADGWLFPFVLLLVLICSNEMRRSRPTVRLDNFLGTYPR